MLEVLLAAMAIVDTSSDHRRLRAVCPDLCPVAHRQLGQGWLQAQRPIDPDRRLIRVDRYSRVHLAHRAAHEPLYQTCAADAHRPDSLDGPDLRTKCGRPISFETIAYQTTF